MNKTRNALGILSIATFSDFIQCGGQHVIA